MRTTEERREYVTNAPPPLPAVALVGVLILVCANRFPSLESIDDIATPDLFMNRVFPDILSLEALIAIRVAFFLLAAAVTLQVTFFSDGWESKVTYLPTSKLRKHPTKFNGIRTQFPFTSVSWNVLGVSFGLSAYIAVMTRINRDVNPWILRAALLTWEMAAPNTLLVSAVVRYAIWPTALKHGSSASCKTWRALLWHNANSAMSLLEASLLGGLPIKPQHMSLGALLGAFYILFSWLYRNRWTPGKGSTFIYFFLDTTLGKTTTIALAVLIGILLLFYNLFSAATQTLGYLDQGLSAHLLFATVIFFSVSRFRD